MLLDLTHTSHTQARTGIQRVARALHRQLGAGATAVTHDRFLQVWRALEPWELANLAISRGGRKRRATWPLRVQWRGRLARALGRAPRHEIGGDHDGLIVPELFSPAVQRALPSLFARVRGPRVALFLDAIPLRFPELTPPGTVARFPAYLQELLAFDGIAAISEESRASLVDYWRWLGAADAPPVAAIPLGVDPVQSGTASPDRAADCATDAAPVVLCVGTLEGRKNHLALLAACESLWQRGARFTLHLIGHVNQQTGGAALERLRALQAAGRPLRYDGPAGDDDIVRAYASCAFTVYPSIAEGFGLPVIESLGHGKPCICSARGCLGESARGGGCLALNSVAAPALATAIARLLDAPAELATLAAAARARRFKTWADYTGELVAWMNTVPRRG